MRQIDTNVILSSETTLRVVAAVMNQCRLSPRALVRGLEGGDATTEISAPPFRPGPSLTLGVTDIPHDSSLEAAHSTRACSARSGQAPTAKDLKMGSLRSFAPLRMTGRLDENPSG